MRSSDTLHAAALESARIYTNAVALCAVDGGILSLLDDFGTSDDLARRFGVVPDKRPSFAAILDILVAEDLVEKLNGSPPRYRRVATARADRRLDRYRARADVLDDWLPSAHADLIVGGQRQLLGPDLGYLRTSGGRLSFDAAWAHVWQANLNNPLYEYGRLAAVLAIARRGGVYLDLAGGTGLGAQRLAQLCEGECDITIVDKSADFLQLARRLGQESAGRWRFVRRDLNTGLPPVPAASVDGILFLGSFHYMSDKPRRLAEMYRALRPGAAAVIGHCFVRSGYDDELMNNYSFSLASEASYVDTREQLLGNIADAGFDIDTTFDRGSHLTVVARRPLAERPRGGGMPP